MAALDHATLDHLMGGDPAYAYDVSDRIVRVIEDPD